MAKDILKEAIADAKAVREVALANAKAALEEAFTPKLQSMLSAKLSEELDEEINEEEGTNESVEETTIEEDSFDEMYNYEEEKKIQMVKHIMEDLWRKKSIWKKYLMN